MGDGKEGRKKEGGKVLFDGWMVIPDIHMNFMRAFYEGGLTVEMAVMKRDWSALFYIDKFGGNFFLKLITK